MNFTDFQDKMSSIGVHSLAEIARRFQTTPQAVSNWKSRDQVPYYIVLKLEDTLKNKSENKDKVDGISNNLTTSNFKSFDSSSFSLFDMMLIAAKQLKLILLTPFITVFITFTYIYFIQEPIYTSWATILLPDKGSSDLDGISGLVSQFGLTVPSNIKTDLSSPTLFPEIINSRTFAERMLEKEFFTNKYNKKLTLLSILSKNQNVQSGDIQKQISKSLSSFGKMIAFDQDPTSAISQIRVRASEPIFAKNLVEVALTELEVLNRYYKSQSVKEKISFIDNRIKSVKDDLLQSEIRLKKFNERNRQLASSPVLQLEQDRLARELDVHKGMYLTLKQQFELAKIEEVQESTIFQILDKPQVALGPSNKNLKLSVILSGIIGIVLGLFLGLIRGFANSEDTDDRKKLRRVKIFLKKKTIGLFEDPRISGAISIMMLSALPLYINYNSQNPVYFNKYSFKFLIILLAYIAFLLTSSTIFIISLKKRKK